MCMLLLIRQDNPNTAKSEYAEIGNADNGDPKKQYKNRTPEEENTATNDAYNAHYSKNAKAEYAEIGNVDSDNSKKHHEYEKLAKVTEKSEYEKMMYIASDTNSSVKCTDNENLNCYEALKQTDKYEHRYEKVNEKKEFFPVYCVGR